MDRLKIIKVLSVISWMALLIIAYEQKKSFHKDPLTNTLLFLVIVIHIIHENYRKKKKDGILEALKNQNIEKLKKYKHPLFEEDDFPGDFKPYKEVINMWGIKNKTLRQDLYEKSNKQDLIMLKNFIEVNHDKITNHHDYPKDKKLKDALNLTLKSYNDLGLWTWDSNIKSN